MPICPRLVSFFFFFFFFLYEQTGIAWYQKAVLLNESFQVQFNFQIRAQSRSCQYLQQSSSYCDFRGGDGLAVVMSRDPSCTLPAVSCVGQSGSGLGFGGLSRTVAVEFDTWYDRDNGDMFDNHASVQTSATSTAPFAHTNTDSTNHAYSLAASTDIPDLSDGTIHSVTVRYNATVDPRILHPQMCSDAGACDRLQSWPYFAELVEGGAVVGEQIGTLWVYIDGGTDTGEPQFIAPVDMRSFLKANSTMLGLSASTGAAHWQIHDIFDWSICTSYDMSSHQWSTCENIAV
jgi:Bacterial lectin